MLDAVYSFDLKTSSRFFPNSTFWQVHVSYVNTAFNKYIKDPPEPVMIVMRL